MTERKTDYKVLLQNAEAVLSMTENRVSNLSNASALLYDALDNVNWAGFYLMEENRLTLGPFQGKLACVLIEIGRGVCGTAALRDETLLVPDVHKFPGHIACDSASNSEIVIPLHKDGAVIGVMDIDSPLLSRFSEEDLTGLEAFARLVEKHI